MNRILVLLVVLVVSCNKNGKENNPPELRPICGDDKSIACLPFIEWNIESTSVNFPQNILIKINGRWVADTCMSRDSIKFDMNPMGRTIMKFGTPYWPKDTFTVEILDLGADCHNNAIFASDEEPVYSTSTITVEGRKFRSVYVNLEN